MADYKQKYEQLKATFLSTVQNSYRLGMEAGINQAQQQNALQQAADATAKLQALQNPQQLDANGQPIAGQPMAGQGQPNQDGSQLSQLDQSGQTPSSSQSPIGQQDPNAMDEGQGTELDNHINELSNLVQKGQKPSLPELRQKLEQIQDLRKSQKQVKPPTKKIESSQKQLLNSILKSWKDEVPKTASSIADIIAEAEAKTK